MRECCLCRQRQANGYWSVPMCHSPHPPTLHPGIVFRDQLRFTASAIQIRTVAQLVVAGAYTVRSDGSAQQFAADQHQQRPLQQQGLSVWTNSRMRWRTVRICGPAPTTDTQSSMVLESATSLRASSLHHGDDSVPHATGHATGRSNRLDDHRQHIVRNTQQ